MFLDRHVRYSLPLSEFGNMLKSDTVPFCVHHSVAATVIFAAASLAQIAAQTPSSANPTNQQAATNNIVLDLAVRDHHNKPVVDLRPDEISLSDNGAPVKLSGFNLIDGKAKDDPLVTLFFERPGMQDTRKGSDDLMFGRSPKAARESGKQLHDAAAKFLKAFPGTGFKFAVVDAWGRLQIQQGYTSDRKAITKAVSDAVQPDVSGSRVAANAEEKRQIQIAKTGQDTSGSAVSVRERIIARSMYTALQSSSHIARDQHVSVSLACLLALAEAQRSVPGPKAIVYFASPAEVGDDDSNWLSQDGHAKDTIHSIIGAANRAGTNLYIVLPDEVEDTDQMANIFTLASMSMSLTPGSVDITAGGSPLMDGTTNFAMAAVASQKPSAIASRDNLNVLARQTGGDVVNANSRMSGAIRELIQSLTTYYEASFLPLSGLEDGSFHQTVFKTSRRGLRVRARTGYLALPPSAGMTEPPQPFELPLMALLKEQPVPSDVDYRAHVLRMGGQDEGNVSLCGS